MPEPRRHRSAREWVGTAAFPWPSVHELDVGDVLVGCYCLVSLQVGTTRAEKPFLTLQLSDRYGTLEGKVWDDADAVRARIESASFVGVRGRIETFRDARQLKVESIDAIEIADDELELFLPRSRRDFEEMDGELRARIRGVRDPALRELLARLLGPETMSGRAFRHAPAAKYNHHAYIGGLLEHTLSVAGVCDRLAQHYGPRLDRDLLIAGALLHDIGKTREIAARPGFPYTDEGKLLGHILIGLDMVRSAAREVTALGADRLALLLHLIASHQGKYEWQSPREPRTLEALLLHYADDLDAKMQQALDLVETVRDGWTGYDRSLGRELFRHAPLEPPADDEGPAAADERPPPAPPDSLDLFGT